MYEKTTPLKNTIDEKNFYDPKKKKMYEKTKPPKNTVDEKNFYNPKDKGLSRKSSYYQRYSKSKTRNKLLKEEYKKILKENTFFSDLLTFAIDYFKEEWDEMENSFHQLEQEGAFEDNEEPPNDKESSNEEIINDEKSSNKEIINNEEYSNKEDIDNKEYQEIETNNNLDIFNDISIYNLKRNIITSNIIQ